MSDKLVSVECDESRELVEIHLDSSGIEYLIDVLTRLRDSPPPEHVHLMTPDWGGNELNESSQNLDLVAAKHLKICLW